MAYRRTSAVLAKEQRTRDAVLQAATVLVGRQGLSGTSVADVAAEAGVAVGTVYRHFSSKSDLVCEVLRRTCRHELDVVAAIAAVESASSTDRLDGAVRVFTRRALESGRMAHAMIIEPTFADVERLRLDIRRELAGIFAGIVADGVASDEFGPCSPDVVGIALVGAMSEVLVGPLSAERPAATDDLVDELRRFARSAVGARRPPVLEVVR